MLRPRRIVSLLPSGTEIVAALGMLDQLVGRSHECDFPPEVQRLPICCRPRIDVSLPGAEIDRQVKSRLHAGLSIFEVDTPLLRELQPDVILTQTQCDVCAVTPQDLEAALTHGDHSPSVIDLRPQRLEQLFGDIHVVAMALHVSDRGHDLVVDLRGSFESLRHQTVKARRKPTVGCLEWFEPLMAAGNWIPELVEIAGGENAGAEPGQHSPWFRWEQLVEADPEVLVLMPCGWDIARARAESVSLTSDPRWSQLAAVRAGRVFVTDGHQFFNRPGPRLLESAQILAEILHPAACDFGHRGRNWEKL
ncbi:MAG: iron complex transport system substrate-binding protein [Planctomycetota bacterium]|nr:MAG: iron complex transport system substrate-binding protein [Planctomycetota bacterium]